jgi:hypothetical protein
MNMKKIAFCAALLCVVAEPAMAAEYRYRTTANRVVGFLDLVKSLRSIYTTSYSGRYYQWFGKAYECPSSGSSTESPCKYTWQNAVSVATAWKVGGNGSFTTPFYMPQGVTSGISLEFGRTVTDTDTFSREYTFDAGVTALPASFITRQRRVYHYSGAWIRVQDGVTCSHTLIPKGCDKYQWNANTAAASLTVNVAEDSQQTVTYLTYANGKRPSGYSLETDSWFLKIN